MPKVEKSDAARNSQLSPDQCEVTRRKGTEAPLTGEYWDNHARGIYRCIGCSTPLFGSSETFESGTGWPSYWQSLDPSSAHTEDDSRHDMERTEGALRNRPCTPRPPLRRWLPVYVPALLHRLGGAEVRAAGATLPDSVLPERPFGCVRPGQRS